jgi:hypothetical protein
MNWIVPENLKKNYISGYTYYKFCDWNLCPRYKIKFDINELKDGDLVFCNLDYLHIILQYFDGIRPSKKLRLLFQNSDRDFSQEIFSLFEPFVEKVFTINAKISHPKIIKIPIGFNDQSSGIIDNKDLTFVNKTQLVWVNFRTGHHISRVSCLEYFIDKNWVTYRNEVPYLPVSEYYDNLRNFKYCICPRGAGIDTHRLYECLIYGVIPIVKTNELADLYEKMPILIVDDWSVVTQEFLENNYEKKLEELLIWTQNNNQWFLPKFWIK